MKNVRKHYLLVIKFLTKNVLCNFYVKHTVIKKNACVTKNVKKYYKLSFQLFFDFFNNDA